MLGDPKHGKRLHLRANARLTDDYDEAVGLVRQGFSIRMTSGGGAPPSLVSPKSLTFEEVDVVPVGAIPPKLPKAPVSRAGMRSGFQQLLFVQAAVIEQLASAQAASAFLGLEWPRPTAETESFDPIEVELERFQAFDLAAKAYDWAYQAGAPTTFGKHQRDELSALVASAPLGPPSNRSPLADPESDLSRVFGAALARWKLEFEPETKLVVRELAYLAGMGEAAARNALAKDKITSRSGVSAAIARKWLKKRNMFVATDPALTGRA